MKGKRGGVVERAAEAKRNMSCIEGNRPPAPGSEAMVQMGVGRRDLV